MSDSSEISREAADGQNGRGQTYQLVCRTVYTRVALGPMVAIQSIDVNLGV